MKKYFKLFFIFTLLFTLTFIYDNVKAEGEDDPVIVTSTVITSAPVVTVKGNYNSLILTWDTVENATSYTISRSTNAKKGFKNVKTVNGSILTYTDKKLKYGTTYYYKVTANGKENKKVSSVAKRKVQPNKVSNVTLKPGSTQVTVSWNKVSNTGYYVYRSTNGTKWTKVATIKKSKTVSYTDKKLKSNTKYYYQVQAYQKVGRKNIAGPKSDVMNVITSPAAPKVNTGSYEMDNFYLTLNSVSGATRYEIYELINKKYELVDTFLPDYFYEKKATYFRYVDKPYVKHTFRVRACSDISCGSYTTVSVQGQLNKTTINSLKGEKKAVTLKWNYIWGSDGYEVYRATSKKGKYTKIKTLKGDKTSTFKDTKVSTNKTYYYKVRSFIKIGKKTYYSAYSAVRSVKTGKNATVNSALEDVKIINKSWNGFSKKNLIDILVEDYGYTESDAKKGIEKANINFKNNALVAAKDITRYQYAIAEDGLRHELEVSGFTSAEIDYAMSKININWRETLINSITEDLEYGISKNRLLTRYADHEENGEMIYTTGFTEEEVLEVIEELNINFNEQAVKALNNYMQWYSSEMGVSSNSARDYLEDQKFVAEEIDYAIDYGDVDFIAEAVKAYRFNEEYNYSKARVIALLTDAPYEFTSEEVELALDRISVDFNEVAVEAARSEFNAMPRSQKTIKDVLVMFEFTIEEAEYGSANFGGDFNYAAYNESMTILNNDTSGITKDSLISLLSSEGYTEENINYALENIPEYLWNTAAANKIINQVSFYNNSYSRGLSKEGVKELLESDFTLEELNAGFEQANIDFDAQALIQAEYEINNDNISRAEVYRRLINFYKFTENEAASAADNSKFNYNQECVDYINENFIGKTSGRTLDDIRSQLKDPYGFTDENIDYAFSHTDINDYVINND